MKLEPCPFCGGVAKIEREGVTSGDFYPTCQDDGCCGYANTDGEFGTAIPSFKTYDEAVSAWNRRPSGEGRKG